MADKVTLKDICAFFEMSLSDFSKAWKALPDADKAQIKSGLENGTLTY